MVNNKNRSLDDNFVKIDNKILDYLSKYVRKLEKKIGS